MLHISRANVLLYRESDLDGAAKEFEIALRLNRGSFRPANSVTYEAYLGFGQIAARQGRTEEATSYFERATRLAPNSSTAYSALGAVYFPRREYAKAAEYFSQAVKVNPQDVIARFYLGSCKMQLGEYRDAAAQFRAARETDPTYSQAYEAEARALEATGDATGASRVRSLVPVQ